MELESLDLLTGVFQRKYAWPLYKTWFERAKTCQEHFTLLLLDLDHLKNFNDVYSLSGGDKAIKIVAGVLTELWTQSVIPSRYGGEEFAVGLVGLDLTASKHFAEELRGKIANRKFPDFQSSTEVCITVSMGMAEVSDSVENFDQLFRRADVALSAAKDGGRNILKIG